MVPNMQIQTDLAFGVRSTDHCYRSYSMVHFFRSSCDRVGVMKGDDAECRQLSLIAGCQGTFVTRSLRRGDCLTLQTAVMG